MNPSSGSEPRTAAADAAIASLVHAPLAAATIALVAQPFLGHEWNKVAATVTLALPNALLLGAAGGLLEAWVRRGQGRRRWTALAPLALVSVAGVHEAGRALLLADFYPPLVVKLIPVAVAALAVTAAILRRTSAVAPPAEEAGVRVPEGHPWLRLLGATAALLLAGLVAIALLPAGA